MGHTAPLASEQPCSRAARPTSPSGRNSPKPGPRIAARAGGAAFLGHCFPVWLKFKGGKGVATFFGTLIAVSWWPPVGLVAGATWLVVAYFFRISSLAGLTAAALAPFYAFALHAGYPVIVMATFMAVLIFIRHHENIRRLLSGTEPRIGGSKPPTADGPLPD